MVEVLSAMAGATGVHLLLWDEDRQDWLLPAPGGDTPASDTGQERAAPMSVLRYVQRTREPLDVGDATDDDRFARDPYFTDITCCSLLAVPILSRGALRAVLLLENRLIRAAFTTGRLDAVNLIAGQLAVSLDNAQLYAGFRRLAEEQAALRRVATLVAAGAPPEEAFAAVAEEAGRLFLLDVANMCRYEPDGTATIIASAGGRSVVGTRLKLEGKNATTLVHQTGRAARIESYTDASGPLGAESREGGVRSSVGTPIMVEGRLWGVLGVGTRTEQPLPPDAEARLASFTELVATAIANAESRSELAASRRRIVAASDQARRRIERDLHDGTQQRLVSLALAARTAEADVAAGRGDPRAHLSRIAAGLADAVAELQELSRGIHPAALSEHGLGPALRTLARRSAVPVDLAITTNARCPEPIEVAAYYVASEALANTMKHAKASHAEISLSTRDGTLLLSIRDDGVGGANPARGSGLAGLTDRVEALGGSIHLHSTAGAGTHITVDLPLNYELAEGAGLRVWLRQADWAANRRRRPCSPG